MPEKNGAIAILFYFVSSNEVKNINEVYRYDFIIPWLFCNSICDIQANLCIVLDNKSMTIVLPLLQTLERMIHDCLPAFVYQEFCPCGPYQNNKIFGLLLFLSGPCRQHSW